MYIYRLCKRKYAGDLSGAGAKIAGGRWNNKGTAILYTSETASLCLLEVLVHIPSIFLPKNMVLTTIHIPDDIEILTLPIDTLPEKWYVNPPPSKLQYIVKKWVDHNDSLILKVPSAIVTQESNFLINPNHQDFSSVIVEEIVDFPLDKRLSE